MTYWLTDPVIQDRFAVFGQTADLNMFAVWKQDDGKMPVVLVGQAGLARVLAADMDDFIQPTFRRLTKCHSGSST
jgi:hypothetical protein